MPLLEAQGIEKSYCDVGHPLAVLNDLHFAMEEGELVGIFGASGAGKSTLLHLLGGLDEPTRGSVRVRGRDIGAMSPDELATFRNRGVGFVFQFYHLLAEFTAVENVMLPALIGGASRREAEARAREVLEAMGLGARLAHRPAMLSGGERQRVAIARAAVMDPPMILADEPTGNLDHRTGEQVFEYLLSLHRERRRALVVVTHNRDLLERLPRVLELADGKLWSISGDREHPGRLSDRRIARSSAERSPDRTS